MSKRHNGSTRVGAARAALAMEARASGILERQPTDPTPSLRATLAAGVQERLILIGEKEISMGCRVRFKTRNGAQFVVESITTDGRLVLRGIEGYTLPSAVEVVHP